MLGHTPVIPSYRAFQLVFKSWELYDPSRPPPGYELRRLKPKNLSAQIRSHSSTMSAMEKFCEYRYLADPGKLQRWCSFEELDAQNPRLFGSSQCYHYDRGEVKFVCGLWVRFTEDPRLGMHKRFSLKAWVSTLHWNTTLFNSGDSDHSEIGKMRDGQLRKNLTAEEQLRFGQLYTSLVTAARNICMPRMKARESRKRDAASILRRKIEKQRQKAGLE